MTTLIRSATVVDGSESPRYRADVLVDGDRIADIRPEADHSGTERPTADRVIDAEGLVLAPGFIDMHAHSDLQILIDPEHPSRITQGVTTEVLGQDGLSYAPVTDDVLAVVRRKIAGWNTDPEDFDFSWRSVGDYLDRSIGASPPTSRISSRTGWSGRWWSAGTTGRRRRRRSRRCSGSWRSPWRRVRSGCPPG